MSIDYRLSTTFEDRFSIDEQITLPVNVAGIYREQQSLEYRIYPEVSQDVSTQETRNGASRELGAIGVRR